MVPVIKTPYIINPKYLKHIVKSDTCFHIRASVKLICIDYIWKSKYLWVINGIIFFTQISPYAIK